MKKILLTFAMLATVAGTTYAQSRTIKGRVVDSDGEAVPGAVITIKGTTTAVTTDFEGNYTIDVPSNNNVLVITSMDMPSKEVSLTGNQSTYVTKLVEEKSRTQLSEATIYGSKIDRRTYVGSVSQVTSEDIEKRPVTSAAAALDGAAPGVSVTSGGGQPGNNPDIMLRGQGSLSASSAPLIVLDGAPYSGSLTSINPLDIESMTVLKDATSKAVYGSRAANGVILITTKKGKNNGKPRIAFDASVGFYTRMIKEYERVGVKDYYELAYEGYSNYYKSSGLSGKPSSAEFVQFLGNYNAYNVSAAGLIDTATGKVIPGNNQMIYNDDWQKEMLRTGVRQNYNVSVSNGDDKSDYYFSVGYTKDDGIVKNSSYDRITALINVNSRIASWLKSGFKLQTTYDEQVYLLGSGTAYSNVFFSTREMGAIYPVYRYDSLGNQMKDEKGNLVYDFGFNDDGNTPGNVVQDRPYGTNTNSIASLTYNRPSTTALTGNGTGYLEANFLKDFTAKALFSVNLYNGIQTNYYNSQFGDAANVNGRMSKGNYNNMNFTFNQFISWNPSFGPFVKGSDHTLNVTVGHENYNLLNKYSELTRIGFAAPGFFEGALAASGEGSTSYENRRRIETYFAQAAYSFKNRYYVQGSVSRNGSSKFSPDVRWGTFGSAGAGWVISEENFMAGTKSWLDLLKIRASWGITGNDGIGDWYGYMTRFADNNNATNPGVKFNIWGNNDLKWEGMIDLNAGFDASLLNRRINASLDVYSRGSNALLYVQPLASSTGSTGYYANVGSMRNKGIELQLQGSIIRAAKPGDFSWNVKVNLSHNKNAITEVQGDQDTIIGSGTLLTKGLAVGTFYMPEYAGVDANGNAMYYTGKGYDSTTTDYNALTSSDYRTFGSSFRKVEGSFTTNFAYKNFDLSVLFTFGIGGKFYDSNYAGLMGGGSGRIGNSIHVDQLNAWRQAGDELKTDIPKFSYGTDGQFVSSLSNRFLVSNGFFNIKNVTLGYTFAPKVLQSIGFNNLRIYASGENLFLKAARQGIDPQIAFFGTSSYSYFPARTVVFGVNVNL